MKPRTFVERRLITLMETFNSNLLYYYRIYIMEQKLNYRKYKMWDSLYIYDYSHIEYSCSIYISRSISFSFLDCEFLCIFKKFRTKKYAKHSEMYKIYIKSKVHLLKYSPREVNFCPVPLNLFVKKKKKKKRYSAKIAQSIALVFYK